MIISVISLILALMIVAFFNTTLMCLCYINTNSPDLCFGINDTKPNYVKLLILLGVYLFLQVPLIFIFQPYASLNIGWFHIHFKYITLLLFSIIFTLYENHIAYRLEKKQIDFVNNCLFIISFSLITTTTHDFKTSATTLIMEKLINISVLAFLIFRKKQIEEFIEKRPFVTGALKMNLGIYFAIVFAIGVILEITKY